MAGMIQGKLQIRSVPGAFLLLGVVVVFVGTTLAVVGYWPYRISKSILGASDVENISESHISGWSLEDKSFSSTSNLIQNERMKLLGPVIMGVGLFILICANTVLYENRDRETQMLLAQVQSVMCSVSTAVPLVDLKEITAATMMPRHYQWVSTLPAAHLNILCLQQLASSEPLLQTRPLREQEHHQQGIYQLTFLHHQESEPLSSLHSSHSNSCNCLQTELETQHGSEQCGNTGLRSQPTSFIKLNSCLMSASSMCTLGEDAVDVPPAQPRRCHSMSYRTKHYVGQKSMCVEEGFNPPGEECAVIQQTVTWKEVCVNIPEHTMDAAEEQAHCSWPQIDLGRGRRYLKLENKEDSVDKLLDQLEQQCSHWNKSFGSGPFQ